MKATTDSKTSTRPLPAEISDVALLDIRDVIAAVRMSASWIHEEVRAGRFPAPLRYGQRCSRWTTASLRAWLIARAEKADVDLHATNAVTDKPKVVNAATKSKRGAAAVATAQ